MRLFVMTLSALVLVGPGSAEAQPSTPLPLPELQRCATVFFNLYVRARESGPADLAYVTQVRSEQTFKMLEAQGGSAAADRVVDLSITLDEDVRAERISMETVMQEMRSCIAKLPPL